MATFHDIETSDDQRDSWDGDGLPPGVIPALLGLLGLLLVVTMPYVVGALTEHEPRPAGDESLTVADYRVWVSGDPVPFSKHFSTDGTGPAVAEAGATGVRSGDLARVDQAHALAAEAEKAVADAPVVGPVTIQPRVAPVTPAPVADPDPTAEPTTPTPAAPVDPISRIVVPAAAFDGVKVEIEDPHGAMTAFYEALAKTALAAPGAITRIAQWGDSAIAADGMTSMTRRLLQRTFGDAGHGFSLIAAGNNWYKRKDVVFASKGWRAQQFIRKQAGDRRYGFGGVAALGYQGARASWETVEDGPVGKAASRFEVHYSTATRGGRLAVSVDKEQVKVIDTRAATVEDKVVTIEVDDAPHVFEIKNVGGGATRVFGVVIERGDSGIVYDSLGIIGARASRQFNVDPAHFASQLQTRGNDLRIVMYGGNALTDTTPMKTYSDTFAEVLQRFKGDRNKVSCLVMSPLDHGERYRGRIRTVPRLYKLMDAQRQAALDSGCAWFSLFDAMGGEGAIGEWFAADPRLAASDLAHPTAHGAKVLGNLFFKALMKGFSDFVQTRK